MLLYNEKFDFCPQKAKYGFNPTIVIVIKD